MALALKQLKVYLKLIAIIAAVAMALLVVLMNSRRTANIWFFYERDVPVLWLILATAVLAIVGWWGVRKVIGVLRDFRDLRRAQEAQRQVDEQRRLADEVAQREKRIDEKLHRSITEDT